MDKYKVFRVKLDESLGLRAALSNLDGSATLEKTLFSPRARFLPTRSELALVMLCWSTRIEIHKKQIGYRLTVDSSGSVMVCHPHSSQAIENFAKLTHSLTHSQCACLTVSLLG